MRDVDQAGLRLCAIQGRLFEASLETCMCGSAIFVRRFMNSDVARRMDEGSYLGESAGPDEVLSQLERAYSPSSYGSARYAADELAWMGYVYRYWCCVTGMGSKAAYRVAGAREMRSLFLPYHSLDPRQAVERILEAKGLLAEVQADPIARGVKVMRRVRARRSG